MSQLTFAEAEYQNKKRKTRREIFLEKMDAIIPWKRLENRAAKHYPKGEMGRPPYPLSVMLRVHCLQLFYRSEEHTSELQSRPHLVCRLLLEKKKKNLGT